MLARLVAWSLSRRLVVALATLALAVAGYVAWRTLPIDAFPEVDIPVVVVQTVYPGASPETIEREVTLRCLIT